MRYIYNPVSNELDTLKDIKPLNLPKEKLDKDGYSKKQNKEIMDYYSHNDRGNSTGAFEQFKKDANGFNVLKDSPKISKKEAEQKAKETVQNIKEIILASDYTDPIDVEMDIIPELMESFKSQYLEMKAEGYTGSFLDYLRSEIAVKKRYRRGGRVR
jgi:hypothetical protein